ncbi:hypothetical protein RN001_004956 [Aquatica leii]|uniref:L-lactate dehydrogenase n=1 Tax=Aquatica leii TaxID=1421715 RepID=A0AAN7PBC7_9COLE|nr:hypothetical protein RN001_004956 [Aquatica leii]
MSKRIDDISRTTIEDVNKHVLNTISTLIKSELDAGFNAKFATLIQPMRIKLDNLVESVLDAATVRALLDVGFNAKYSTLAQPLKSDVHELKTKLTILNDYVLSLTSGNVEAAAYCLPDPRDKLFCHIAEHTRRQQNKISIIGIGHVGQAVLASLLFQKITDNIAIYDRDEDKIKGELLDFQYAAMYSSNTHIEGSTKINVIVNSKIVIITAGARRQKGDTRITLVQKNVEVFQDIIPKIVQYAPHAVLILVSNPVDIMTYITDKISCLPPGQVVGSGTNLDTSRLHFYMSHKYNVAAESCKGWVIGEHGETAVIAYSTLTVGGTYIEDINFKMGESCDIEKWSDIHNEVLTTSANIISLKGYTNWAIGLSVADLAHTIITNNKSVHPVTVSAKGFYCITEDVYLSLPAVLGENGVIEVVRLELSSKECELLRKSADYLYNMQKEIKI